MLNHKTPENEPSAKGAVAAAAAAAAVAAAVFVRQQKGWQRDFVAYLVRSIFVYCHCISQTNTHVVTSQTAGVQKDVLAA